MELIALVLTGGACIVGLWVIACLAILAITQ
jgi:hypothetical protein